MNEQENLTESCLSCRFEKSKGKFCLRFPPVVVQTTLGSQFQFTQTSPSNWCGEWRPKEKPKSVEDNETEIR